MRGIANLNRSNPGHHAEAGLSADSVDGVVGSLNQENENEH